MEHAFAKVSSECASTLVKARWFQKCKRVKKREVESEREIGKRKKDDFSTLFQMVTVGSKDACKLPICNILTIFSQESDNNN